MKNPLESLSSTVILGIIITVVVVMLVNVTGSDAGSLSSDMPSMPG